MGFKEILNKSILRRGEIISSYPESVRLFHGRIDNHGDLYFSNESNEFSAQGLTIDLFKNNLLITAYVPGFNSDEIISIVGKHFPLDSVYYQPRYEKGMKKPCLIHGGGQSPFIINENGLFFEIDFTRGLNSGFFLDTRAVRVFLKEGGAKNKRVLNQFSYTCAMGVAALKGGARSVVNVDSSKSVMERGKLNYKLNSLKPDERGFVRSDMIKKMKYWSKRGVDFDLIIMDPPPWFPGKGPAVGIYPLLLKWSLKVLAPNGKIIAICREPSMVFEKFNELLGVKGNRILPHFDIWPEQKGDPVLKIFHG
jgi:23S rRNA G2069 N7-methylase RlmK/C1962 C5-methylase RlmI